MGRPLLDNWADVARPIIGMAHLLPLPGSARYGGDFDSVRRRATADAMALAEGGVHAVMLENFGDVPFYRGRAPAETVAAMTAIAAEIRSACDLPLGVNVLRNDGRSALAVALATGAQFIRVNVLCGARLTDQGIIEAIAHDLLRDRARLGAGHIRIMADVDVKHSSPLGAARPIEDEVADTIERGLADAVIVSGAATGRATDLAKLQRVKAAAGDVPVFIGSGVTADTIAAQLALADGAIVGTALKRDGAAENQVDIERVRDMMRRVR